ncbi:hypothetical protein BCR32DRAFT_292926 [Anaeromyces robustus]|uniref:Uncharacterized protein n=1 Tax=Anaeromyces robustus TaxID=1754192 RepID=A0A1Y1X9L5_9FUNG|nr:hypothetical protein BCR32DRAFT_292926 [Anaeromyces robustus]|eukprot:ORX82024.1 hypothetical protein BCR32DRAFT_292926 [Anaeromyces robustus]
MLDCNTKLVGYSEADFSNDEIIRRSTHVYVFLLEKSPITWKSQIQRNVNTL